MLAAFNTQVDAMPITDACKARLKRIFVGSFSAPMSDDDKAFWAVFDSGNIPPECAIVATPPVVPPGGTVGPPKDSSGGINIMTGVEVWQTDLTKILVFMAAGYVLARIID
jgi:hypothetical protein